MTDALIHALGGLIAGGTAGAASVVWFHARVTGAPLTRRAWIYMCAAWGMALGYLIAFSVVPLVRVLLE